MKAITTQPSPTTTVETIANEAHIHSNMGPVEDRVRGLHDEIISMGRKTLTLVRELGGILSDLKNQQPHGTWETYTFEHLKIHSRTASNYIRIWGETHDYAELDDYAKSENISDLSIVGLLKHFSDKKKPSASQDPYGILAQKASQAKSAKVPIHLADGSMLDTHKLGLDQGLIDEALLRKFFAAEVETTLDPPDVRRRAIVQRTTASLAAGLRGGIGRRTGLEAIEIAEAAIAKLLGIVQELKKEKLSNPPAIQ